MKGNVSGYVCNHGSPSVKRDTASPRLCAMIRTQASDEEVDDVLSRCPLYMRPICDRAGNDVCMYALDTRHADGVAYSNP